MMALSSLCAPLMFAVSSPRTLNSCATVKKSRCNWWAFDYSCKKNGKKWRVSHLLNFVPFWVVLVGAADAGDQRGHRGSVQLQTTTFQGSNKTQCQMCSMYIWKDSVPWNIPCLKFECFSLGSHHDFRSQALSPEPLGNLADSAGPSKVTNSDSQIPRDCSLLI